LKSQSKAAFFDMDGTLIEKISWKVVHDYFGVDNIENVRAYEAGDIDGHEFMRRDVDLWPDPTVAKVEKALSEIKLREGAKDLIGKMRKKNYEEIWIISGGIALLAKRLTRELGLDGYLADGFATEEKDGEQKITGANPRFNYSRKDKLMKKILVETQIPIENTWAVGDTSFDIALLRAAKTGVAFHPKDKKIKEVANFVEESDSMKELVKYI